MVKGAKDGNRDINFSIAGIFYEIADILEIDGVKWKPQAYRVAAQMLESLGGSVEDIYVSGGIVGLEELPGIGEALAKKIIEYIETGKVAEHEKLKKSLPPGVYEMMQIPGVGAKKASMFYNKLGIRTVEQLEEKALRHELRNLPGFKEKAESKIVEGISLMKNKSPRIPLKKAEKIASGIVKKVKKLAEVKEAIPAGSLRRKKETIGDIDIVVRTNNSEKVLKKFVKMDFAKNILGVGKEKAIIMTKEGIQVDVRVFTDDEFGAGLLYFTGDKGHNIWLRKIAIKKGWKLNEYGLFDEKNKRIAGKTEEEIYKKLGLKYLSPEKRIGETK